MADFSKRSAHEERISAQMAKLGRADMNDLAGLLGYPPVLTRVPESWWDQHRARVAGELALLLTDVYLDAAREAQEEMPSDIADWAVVQSEAADWAREYADGLAASLAANTRRALAALLSLTIAREKLLTEENLNRRVRDLFGPTRAATIAVTETSRAANQARRRIAALAAEAVAAARTIGVYRTALDERVCPYCSPRGGREITDGVYPPLHPRCRCWVEWRLE